MMYRITDFGAVGDGKTLNTRAIQEAIDTCYRAGGGTVLVEGGVYLFGTIVLRSNVELHLAANATLLGSPRTEDYPERTDVHHVTTEKLPRWKNACYIYCEESENIAITGRGRIDCNGMAFVKPCEVVRGWKYERTTKQSPPRVLFLTGCRDVRLEDFTIVNQPAGWAIWIHDCDYVNCRALRINSEVQYPNNDGIHINSSRNVAVSDCHISCGDDCIIVRANNVSLAENKVCEKVVVTNCNLTSYSAGIRVGYCCDGVIRDCTFSNLVMTDTSVGISLLLPAIRFDPNLPWTADVGREATRVENLSFNNIIMDKVFAEPIKIHIFPDTELCRVDRVHDLYFSNIHASSARGIRMVGRPENPIENVQFSNCTFKTVGYDVFDDAEFHGIEVAAESHGEYPLMKHCRKIRFNDVEFF